MGTRDRWHEHVEQWASSGLTAAQYGDRAGVNPRTLTYWKWRLGQESRERVTPTTVAAFVEVHPRREEGFELELRGGRRLRVPASFDEPALRRLIELLEGST
jgi:hypothetical protein